MISSRIDSTIRLYGIYILFIFAIMGAFLLIDVNKEPLPMSVFIKDIGCSDDQGSIIIQSWDYNDYPLPGVSLEISNIGNLITSDDGTVAINSLDNGTYHVSASKNGYEQKSFSFTISCPTKKIIIRPQE